MKMKLHANGLALVQNPLYVLIRKVVMPDRTIILPILMQTTPK